MSLEYSLVKSFPKRLYTYNCKIMQTSAVKYTYSHFSNFLVVFSKKGPILEGDISAVARFILDSEHALTVFREGREAIWGKRKQIT